MSRTAIADALQIVEGFTVWVVGGSVEETALLDPLPEGATTVDQPHDYLDAAVLLVDSRDTLADQLDEVLPHVGSTPFVWVCFPPDDIDRETVGMLVGEFGWMVGEPIVLDETWSALRLLQA